MKISEAWSPFEPCKEKPWTRALASHLFRRAGFGASYAQLQAAALQAPGEVVEGLFGALDSPDFLSQMRTLERQSLAGGGVERLPNIWLYRMVKSEAQLLEKATLFWHGHFATGAEKVDDVRMMLTQNQMLRNNALGSFEVLVQAISKDPAMLTYLDSKENRKTRPNENYARELMELFCMGLGNYSEQDIKQVARAFTGWEIRNDKFRFNQHQHDFGTKQFLGNVGDFDGDQAVSLVIGNKASSHFIAGRLINYFVTDLDYPQEVVERLAGQLRESNFDIGHAVRTILSSNFFFESVGKKIRSPVELGVGLYRNLEATGNFIRLSEMMRDLGQLPFFPPNVKGWPGGRTWINSATLLGRINLVGEVLADSKTKLAHEDLAGLVAHYDVNAADQMLEFFSDLFLASPISKSSWAKLRVLASDDRVSKSERVRQTVFALAALPEFQLA